MVINVVKSPRGRTAWQFCLLLKSRGVLASRRTSTCLCPIALLFVTSDHSFALFSRVRFAPPLVISDEDMKEAVKTIGECLVLSFSFSFFFPIF